MAYITDTQLAASNGSSLVGFLQAGADAEPRTAESKLRETVSVQDFMGTLSTAEAIQAAIDAVSAAGGGTVYFPNGEYVVEPDLPAAGYLSGGTGSPFGETLKYAIEMKSNVALVGDMAVIKVADGVSTDTAPQNFAVFYSEEALSNLQFRNIIFDMNGQNNKFSAQRANETLTQENRYKRLHQAAIFFEGEFGKADNVTIQNCTFKNGAGICSIITGRVAPVSGMGKKWSILDCTFRNNGLDTYDASSVFLWCDYGTVSGCHFENDALYAPSAADLSGVNAAIETHGAHATIENNTIINTNRGIFVTYNLNYQNWGGPEGYPVSNLVVRNNLIRASKFSCIDLFFAPVDGVVSPHNITIADNLFVMTGDDTNVHETNYPSAINMIGSDGVIGPVRRLSILRNDARRDVSVSGRSSHFFTFALQAAGFEDLRIEDNQAYGFTRGIYVVTDEGASCSDLALSRNKWRNPEGGALPTVPMDSIAGVFLLAQGGAIGRFYCDDEVIDTRSTLSWRRAVKVAGAMAVGQFEVARSARFDRRFAIGERVDGWSGLSISRLHGVPVSGAYPDTGYATLTGAAVSVAYPGISTEDDLVVGHDVTPTNAGGLIWSAFASGTNQVSYSVRNVSANTLFTTPGWTFYITAYPR